MKFFILLIISVLLSLFDSIALAQSPLVYVSDRVEKQWEVQGNLRTPESVLFDEVNNDIYVSNINGSPLVKDGDGFISKIDAKGNIVKLQWVRGLHAPKGMGIFQNHLYVTDINQLVIIDLQQEVVIDRIDIPEAKFLNDICIDKQGRVFISDSKLRVIFCYHNGNVEKWYEGDGLSFPNGLCIHADKLYVGNYTYILEMDLKTRASSKIIENIGGGVDGIKLINNNEFLISDWTGNVYHIDSNHKLTKLIGTAEVGINAADFEFISKSNLLLIPTFGYNTIAGYKIN
ncbi:MAG: hypothetical protein JEZ03_14320 [Bacteroidales bacterium]|nr:hypothetical protein [Bacteroidales bacterium]